MPKKRFSSQYSKPQSTVHPSLNSGASSSSTKSKDAAPSVNELITSLRKTQVSSDQRPTSSVTTAHTLPPQIRHLLSLPETPTPSPRTRDRRRHDADGRLRPAGPAPPRSWLDGPRHAPAEIRNRKKNERAFPHDLHHLPGYPAAERGGRRLQDMCLRGMAYEWEFVREWEKNNLADVPTGLRMALLSNIAVFGPENGVGWEGLKAIIISAMDEEDAAGGRGENNETFFRIDLSGAIGRSISFKQLTELVSKPDAIESEEDLSWEESIARSLSPPIPHLTHLSLSHPSPTISWPRLLNFAAHTPTLTHLSLAYWPVPSLTPNSKTTVMSSPHGRDVQYGGTNYYSRSLDNDFSEPATILRKLAKELYSLEYLDLTGCLDWWRALWDSGDGNVVIQWGHEWPKLKELRLGSGIVLSEDSEMWEVRYLVDGILEAVRCEDAIVIGRREKRERRGWVQVVRDSAREYEGFWRGSGEEERVKRRLLDRVSDHNLEAGRQGRLEEFLLNPRWSRLVPREEFLRSVVWDFEDGRIGTQ